MLFNRSDSSRLIRRFTRRKPLRPGLARALSISPRSFASSSARTLDRMRAAMGISGTSVGFTTTVSRGTLTASGRPLRSAMVPRGAWISMTLTCWLSAALR